jgi:mono/diheme cytochrome c family protein
MARTVVLRLALVCGALAATPLTAADVPEAKKPSAEEIAFFEKKVRPLLVDHCQKCHGADKQTSGLRLDTREGAVGGGERGPAAVPGKPEDSLLMTAVGYENRDLQMPPDKKLSDQQIADLKHWIKLGVPYPEDSSSGAARPKKPVIDIEKGRAFWAFQPPRDPPPPRVGNAAWASTPLDRFILAALEAKGLRPAPRADKRTLIRRATFDLIGLPPTPEEVEVFVADESPQAFARVVERLLASPHYGERWGRHWLDVARYADSNGLDENICHGNAWRYRDWVVAALNADKPYDQFVIEQLAGDLLPIGRGAFYGDGGGGDGGGDVDEAQRHQRLIATGFLALGPKVLAEVDETKMEMDIIDEQVSTVSQTFLGLTLGCARCHDHKFDPLPTEDYYALAGIFKSTKTMEHFKKIARWHENSLATAADLARKAEHEQLIAAKQAQINRVVGEASDRVKGAAAARGQQPPKDLESQYPDEVKTQLRQLRDELAVLQKAAPEMPAGMGVTEGQAADLKVHIRGSHLSLGASVPRGFPQVVSSENASALRPGAGQGSGRLELARWITRADHPLTARVMVNRLWRWHFGRGIVGTPDNFGALGERPTHPELLDWLARRFVESGWSIKAMHRLIMLSATYQMSSRHDEAAARVDPENLLHWRASIRRLEVESLRDAVLAVSGALDPEMGGSLVHVKNREFFFDHTSKDTTKYDSPRRSIYLPVVRNHMYDVFDLFDYTDATVPSGDRATSTVAPQALFALNSEVMSAAGGRLAESLLAKRDLDDAGRVQRLYAKAYGRPAATTEVRRAAEFIDRVEQILATRVSDAARRQRAWALLCQSVLAASEFGYVR